MNKDVCDAMWEFALEAARVSGIDLTGWTYDDATGWRATCACSMSCDQLVFGKSLLDDDVRLTRWVVLHELGHAKQKIEGRIRAHGWWGFMWEGEEYAMAQSGLKPDEYVRLPWELDASRFAFEHPMCPPDAREAMLASRELGYREHALAYQVKTLELA